ncbi:GPI inositol-deacylase [Pieris rapae]|uniref:GPI inositol-deacylase n=1 Tax=Pieris rapae TaxID=64459 RepID=UPI001E2807AA|nr:GPI inositol-deacylase [Pieris rapae]
MISLKWAGGSIFQLVSIIFLLFYLIGILNVNFSDKNNYCAMTYMFEYPQFVRISMVESNIYPQYGLYTYSEGRFTERARKMWFDGVPVLFLPGNSGSHMQARSLASVALRKALSNGYENHFDYFTISYNEELSGLYGGVLQSQTQFAAACVSKILSLYKNKYTKSIPSSVILIGHSMGGVIAKRLLAYPSTINTTNIAITLAAPLEAPIVNFDPAINDFYRLMDLEWKIYIEPNKEIKDRKLLISFGSGPRDVLVPAGLTSSNVSNINTLASAIPGVWVSPDHISMVWCKQLVLAINRYLFDIIDTRTDQITDNYEHIQVKSLQYFVANRSMTLSEKSRANVNMISDAFWYEDNRRIYQISRPEIDRTTYLMIRLVTFPQNRFVAIETVNVDDKEWLFGCNAKDVDSTYRYCKTAMSLSELSRWSGSATEVKRKVATINLHSVIEKYPEWTHVIVKVSPIRKPITLNVDINDYASRQIVVNLPSTLSFTKHVIKQETEPNSLYYELILPDLNAVHEAYLLYVEPVDTCHTYHVTAEMQVPWAKNNEYYHYFTHLKRSPMKLRLFKSNPNVTSDEKIKITLLLDPKCSFTISISGSWYYRLAQLVRNYTPVLVPYVAAIVLLAVRANLISLKENGTCISIHTALMSESVKPYYVLVFSRLAIMGIMSVPLLTMILENASWNNLELQYFTKSLLVLPAYMTALGIVNVAAAGILAVMVFSSQLAHRLLFKIVWRGGNGLAEKVASGLQKVPLVVSAALVCAVPLSCGAAALTAGAAFYAFMISKMYEEYLEDYVYKLLAKIGSRICMMFKKQTKETCYKELKDQKPEEITNAVVNNDCKDAPKENVDEDLNNINFHMMLFFMWMCVTLVNIPALLTWARNFKYSMVLTPDTSYHTGMLMSACSGIVWQMNGPQKKLKFYDAVISLLFTMAVFIIALGPFSLSIINYGVAIMFAIITIQQLFNKEEKSCNTAGNATQDEKEDSTEEPSTKENLKSNLNNINENTVASSSEEKSQNTSENIETELNCDVCNESRLYTMFKNLRDKINFSDDH